MGLQSVTGVDGGFQKLVFENVVDTLPGGLLLDIDPDDFTDGVIPEGSLVGKDNATGLGKVVTITPGDPEAEPATETTYDITPIGLTYRTVKAEVNALVGVVISGTARIKALPTAVKDNADDVAIALPRITFV